MADLTFRLHLNPTVGAGLLAKTASQPTYLSRLYLSPTVGASLLAIAVCQPTSMLLT